MPTNLADTETGELQERRLRQREEAEQFYRTFLLVEAAQATVHSDPRWRKRYFHLARGEGERSPKLRWRED